MFKDLRDQAVVLADLSLENPNVFYELGIRHVMSPRGTVLMSRVGAELPFDVKLSRVYLRQVRWGSASIGKRLSGLVQELQVRPEEAKRGTPDSPVYALLDGFSVTPSPMLPRLGRRRSHFLIAVSRSMTSNNWSPSTGLLAARTCASRTLITVSRALLLGLGYLALGRATEPAEAALITQSLYYAEQYDLANRMYERLAAGRHTRR